LPFPELYRLAIRSHYTRAVSPSKFVYLGISFRADKGKLKMSLRLSKHYAMKTYGEMKEELYTL
jgi:hypothetical protein